MYHLDELAEIISVAGGERPAELVLRDAQVLNVFTGAIESTSLAIHKGRIAGLGDYHGKTETNLKGSVVVPGFIESHMHLESTLLRPEEIAKLLLPRGTTTVICEPHEIANVVGTDGLDYLENATSRLPLDVFFMVPSDVPATSSELETNGTVLDDRDVTRLLKKPSYIGLGEVMDYEAVIHGGREAMNKLAAAAGRPIDGHCPGLEGKELNAYIAAGPNSDHETTGVEEGREKISRGIRLIIREGSASKDFEALIPLVNYMTARRCLMATDDITALDLATFGGIDHLLKMAISREIDPRLAVQMVTLNPAEHYGLGDRGVIAPGKLADLVILEDLTSAYIRAVFKSGRMVFGEGRLGVDIEESGPPPSVLSTIAVSNVAPRHFEILGASGDYRVIGYRRDKITTDSLIERVNAHHGRIAADSGRDIAKISVVNRYSKEPAVMNGLIKGFGISRGSIATSFSHDAHNIVALGADDESMSTAVNAVIGRGGGMAVALGPAVLAELPLEIAGLMSLEPYPEVVRMMKDLRGAAAYLGCGLEDPFSALSFMTLSVAPSLKITDRGLVDVVARRLVDPFVGGQTRRAA